MNTFIKISAFVFSLAALGISAYAVSNQHCENIPTAVLSLVGICATLIVGISVVDTFAVHSALHRMEEKMKEQTDKMKKLDELERKVRNLKKQSNILFHHTWGLAISKDQPFAALEEYWNAFQLAAKEDDISRAKTCLTNAEDVLANIIQRKNENKELDEPNREKLPTSTPPEIMKSKVYVAFEDRIAKFICDIRTALA